MCEQKNQQVVNNCHFWAVDVSYFSIVVSKNNVYSININDCNQSLNQTI